MASTIVVPSKASIGAYSTEIATDQAADGNYDVRIANAVYDGLTAASTDITALQSGSTITGINGASVPAGGALTTGNVLQVTGAAALGYAAVNLAGGANFVTGTLPATNLPDSAAGAKGIVQLAGDLGGSGTAAATPRVGAINSATVPAGGALTTGNVLQVSGASALSYGAVNLAGGANYVSGVLPWANVASNVGNVHSVRGVVTSNVADLANFTVGVYDGLTFAEGERVLLAKQTTAAQDGIYVVGVVGGGTAPLTRASDWPAAAVMPASSRIVVNEGTTWKHSEWFASVAGAVTVATTSPAFYPRVVKGTTAAMVAGVATVATTWLLAGASIQVTRNTLGTAAGHLRVPDAARTAGAGTGSFEIDSSDNTETSTIDYLVTNG